MNIPAAAYRVARYQSRAGLGKLKREAGQLELRGGAPIGWALKLGFYRVFSRKNKRCMQKMSQIGVYLIKGQA
ncbi:hypothetical protein HZU75_07140 [Chitinibacter fontanus]|uniref:Uncharacterized protein n=1 Tax=Chitinibacter fontanus TaxID=1737446 RepID=A0A7D5V9C9_9NEIS|nr:hypothetical protein [Chitinibacter fontanus]QLI81316.1 hypothetical protein HZU75_07140 [Chitinibacter fontanus]